MDKKLSKILLVVCIFIWIFALVYTLSVKADSFLPSVSKDMKQMLLFTGTLDVNDSSAATSLLQIGGYGLIGIFATGSSGTFTSTTVLELQVCPNTTTNNCEALSPAVEFSGPGHIIATSVPFRYIRLKVKTVEGATGVADVFIQAK